MTSPASRLLRLRRSTSAHRHTSARGVAAGAVLLAGLPVGLDYVVQPGDTLSEIAAEHRTTVGRLVADNGLHPSGDRLQAGQSLTIPAAHGRDGGRSAVADPDARRIVHYTVRPGDTASALAVRFRAWTAELVRLNGLDSSAGLVAGQRIRIPVVVAAAARDRDSRPGLERRVAARADASPREVRRIIERTARRHGVDPQLALAVSWQEAGWQQHHVSSADAVGAMQIIPSTGEWMSDVLGRELDLLDVRDNVTAGVVLLRELTRVAPKRQAIAGYYQGLAGVRAHGMYDDTRRYVANVLALERRFERGDLPY